MSALIITAVLICSSISATCQSSPHTITEATLISNAKLRDAARLIEKGKIDAMMINLLNERIVLLNQRMQVKDSMLTIHRAKDVLQANEVQTYLDEIANLKNQRDIAQKEMKHQNKLYKRQKRKTVFAITGTAAVAAAAFIYLK